MKGKLVVVGDALLDRDVEGRVERICPEAPVPVLDEREHRCRPGGAGLAASLAAADGRSVTLLTALGRDAPGRQLASLLEDAGVQVCDLGSVGPTATKLRFLCEGRLLLRVDTGAKAGRVGPMTRAADAVLRGADAVLVSDYGRGIAASRSIRGSVARGSAPVVWDPHPLGAEPVAGLRLATPNRAEAKRLAPQVEGDELGAMMERGRRLARRWGAEAVAVTLGAQGAVLAFGDRPGVLIPAAHTDGDCCGAGDRFAAAVACALADGRRLEDAVAEAVACASAFVRAGGAAAFATEARSPQLERAGEDPRTLVERVRAAGGTVVATGGCFDLLHAGHVAMLEAARALGDCLVVFLNSDDSVRRLKGSDRPLVHEEDRAAILRALAAVDAVVIFDEATPQAVLSELRPDIWAKGGDYAHEQLPEAETVRRWGGDVVVLPYVEGRSTTRLLDDIAVRAVR
jgi:D-beta-D-heptose 7-phosphate kinase / D-beta-D-heptose 1-phosphate adenosyltransferase